MSKRPSPYELVKESYVCCEDFNFLWCKTYIDRFKEMWSEGWSLLDIADYFKRKQQDVLFLIVDLDYKNEIKPRPTGIWGMGVGAT
jgi:hypothetical protein